MLSAKHQIFVDEFSLGHNASRAARAAGYAAESAHVAGCRLLMKDKVIAAVKKREIDAEKVLGVTREGVLAALWDALELAKQQSNPMAMIAACKAISSMCGYDKPQQQNNEIIDSMDANFGRMSDQVLMAIVNRDERRGV